MWLTYSRVKRYFPKKWYFHFFRHFSCSTCCCWENLRIFLHLKQAIKNINDKYYKIYFSSLPECFTHVFIHVDIPTWHLGHTNPLMFSMTPITGSLTFLQKLISLRTSRRDTSYNNTKQIVAIAFYVCGWLKCIHEMRKEHIILVKYIWYYILVVL